MTQSRLEERLRQYCGSGIYPLHMPGHKRRPGPCPGLPYAWDLTEVEGTDDLHDARGILKEAMDRTAALYGADHTRYLVNGSTCGILAGIRAAVRHGDRVAVARNCHKSVYHAIELCGLEAVWILPEIVPDYRICGSVSPEAVRGLLQADPSIRAVILTSPTYEGVLSDIGAIAAICHAHDLPLIVDEAHGAHLGLFPGTGFPAGALSCGADLVIQSPHKTLPSLTQTAWLHLRGDRISIGSLERELDIFETSSPSYPLLASLDACTGLLETEGYSLFRGWQQRLYAFYEGAAALRRFRILGREAGRLSRERIFAYDPGKILIACPPGQLTGHGLARLLRERYLLETEMVLEDCVLAMTSPADAPDALQRLLEALLELEGSLEGSPRVFPDPEEAGEDIPLLPAPETVLPVGQAVRMDMEAVPPAAAAGRICGEYLYCYPPGIPVCAPGERITDRILSRIRSLEAAGCRIRRSQSGAGDDDLDKRPRVYVLLS